MSDRETATLRRRFAPGTLVRFRSSVYFYASREQYGHGWEGGIPTVPEGSTGLVLACIAWREKANVYITHDHDVHAAFVLWRSRLGYVPVDWLTEVADDQ